MTSTSFTRRLVGTGVFVFAFLFQFTLTGQVWINEFHYDNSSTDMNEFVEVAGVAGTDLSTYAIIFYNGSNGSEYETLNLSGTIDNEGGTGYGAVSFLEAGIQNGSPDGFALVNGNTVVQFLSYEGSFTATDDLANGMTSTDVGVQETSSTLATESLQLTGTGIAYADFGWAAPATASTSACPATP